MSKILVFCLKNPKGNPSWLGTISMFLSVLSRSNDIISFDYNIQNPLVRKIHKIYSRIKFGADTHRDDFECLVSEIKLDKILGKVRNNPEAILHISNLTVTEKALKLAPNFLYLDATIFGSEIAGIKNLKEKFVSEHVRNTRKYADRLTKIFTFNEWTRLSLIEDFGISHDKVLNIGFGANLNPFNGQKDYSKGLILTVLRRGLERNKGLFLLLDAFKIAKQENRNLKLAVVGTTCEQIDGVTYYEGYSREKTIELFQEASLFAMPALFEPNGMVYIEALASKTPILGLNRLAFPEFCGYGDYGFIVEENAKNIAQTILFAIKNPIQLEIMGKNGQKYATSRFNWDVVSRKIIFNSIKS